MRISEKKRLELYKAIRDELMEIRLAVTAECTAHNMARTTEDRLDTMLFKAEMKIWAKQREVLGIKD